MNKFLRLPVVFLFLITGVISSAQNFDEKLYESLEYRLIGPFRGGRSAAVTGVPGEPDLYYFGATGGGVWKTENGGETWESISDGFLVDR